MGWKGESRRHSLSRKGIKTNIDKTKRLSVRSFVARGYGASILIGKELHQDDLHKIFGKPESHYENIENRTWLARYPKGTVTLSDRMNGWYEIINVDVQGKELHQDDLHKIFGKPTGNYELLYGRTWLARFSKGTVTLSDKMNGWYEVINVEGN